MDANSADLPQLTADVNSTEDLRQLELLATIGCEGHALHSLVIHPGRKHLIYPLGANVVIQKIASGEHEFLFGHTNSVSCLAVSNSGKLIASGQVNHMGFVADIIVWNFETRTKYATFKLHKVKIQALAFSPNEKYLVSLGSQDDGSVVVWGLENKEAICGAPAKLESAGHVTTLVYSNKDDDVFITGGDKNLRVWTLDRPKRKIRPQDVNTGKIKRKMECIAVDCDDKHFYVGTATGDILKCSFATKNSTDLNDAPTFNNYFPKKNLFVQGITSIALLKNANMLIGAGDGFICEYDVGSEKKIKKEKLDGKVTSIALRGEGHQFFVSTDHCSIYKFNYSDFSNELYVSSHQNAVNDIVFPGGASELFATCSKGDIRVWSSKTNKELLRIQVPNFTCNAIDILHDGSTIVSGWDDTTIKAFLPETGKKFFEIPNAHTSSVTAIASTKDCKRVISGGAHGDVRVWDISNKSKQTFLKLLKEHKGQITSIVVRSDDQQCISSSTDGSCIVWNLVEYTRVCMLQASTLFYCVAYHPEEFQIITSGSDRKIGYWDISDGHLIRHNEAAKVGYINGMNICPVSMGANSNNFVFVTCGDDRLVKLWIYNQGIVTHVGIGHSCAITKVKICPNMKYIVSVGKDGSILRWRFPPDIASLVSKTEAMEC